MLSDAQRNRFDGLLDQLVAALPDELHRLIEEIPVIVEDEPSAKMKADLELDRNTLLCGLHWGIPLTERSVEHSGTMPDGIWLFREPIMHLAGPDTKSLREQIRITLLHEIGHHFGLDEDDLARLGYG